MVNFGRFIVARRARNIYKRKDGRYEGRYIKERDMHGKAKYGSVYAHSYVEAKEKLEIMQAQPENDRVSSKKLVVETVKAYIEKIKHTIKPSTYDVYRRYCNNHIKPYFEGIKCSELSVKIIQEFINKKHKNNNNKNGLSASTIQSVFIFLKNCLKESVPSSIFQVTLPKRAKHKPKVLSLSEQKRLEAAAIKSGDINHIGIILCLYTGIRIGELCGLMWDDIDFDEKQLNIRRTCQRINTYSQKANEPKTKIAYLSPKSKSSNRSIPIPKYLLELLKIYKSKSTDEFVLMQNKKAIEPRNMRYKFKKLLSLASIRNVNFHTTRHTFSVRALENNFDIKTLSEILGHSSPVITLATYAHTLDEHKRKSMESLASVYSL